MAYRPISNPIAHTLPLRQYRIERFQGADLTTEPANVHPSRSPACPNMIRESRGKVRKWIGYHTVKTYPDPLYGVHFCRLDQEHMLVHSGKKIYLRKEGEDRLLYSDAMEQRSMAFQMDKKLYLLDGKKMLVFGDFAEKGKEPNLAIKPAEEVAYVPTILISRNPSGGGVPHEAVNLLTPKRCEAFLSDGVTKVYQLSANTLDSASVKVEKSAADGTKVTWQENTHFTVDRATGKVTFTTAPEKSPVSGQDNVWITYAKTVEGYGDRIHQCTLGTLYGVGGARDRLFVSGSKEFRNRDYYSQINDPTYFGDLWYSVLGQDDSSVMGYSIISDRLAAHLDHSPDQTNIILRRGSLEDGQAIFALAGALQGVGAVSSHSFGVLEGEPLFLSPEGVFAVTASDVLGERYSQLRSYYLNGLLLQQNLQESCAVIYDGFYMLAAGEYLFALDSTQYAREDNKPFSHRQYEGYYRTGIHAHLLYVQNGKLCFGTKDGRLCEFYTDYGDAGCFHDDGKPIHASWLTPEIIGASFYSKKHFRRISIYLGSAVATGCRVSVVYEGIKEEVLPENHQARYFSFRYLTFSKLTFRTDRSPQVIGGIPWGRIRIRKQQGVSFILENDKLKEPLGLYMATVEFTESR